MVKGNLDGDRLQQAFKIGDWISNVLMRIGGLI